MMAARIRIIKATATNVPATLPPLAKNPSSSGFSANAVSAGGAVGVIVNVLTWPGAVMTEMTGVGVHVEVSLRDVELLEEVVDVLTTTGTIGTIDVEVVKVEGDVEDTVEGV